MTEEHVPSEGLGGSVMLLTCKTCNSRAGYELDWQAQKAEQYRKIMYEGPADAPIRARLQIRNGPWIAVDFNLSPDGGTFLGKKKGGPDGATEEFKAEFARRMSDPSTRDDVRLDLRLHGLDHKPTYAEASWLRSAYLAAFCQFGYGLIRDRVYEVVRQQIREPAANLGLAPCVYMSPYGNQWGLYLIPGPHEAAGVIVFMGKRLVHLPLPGDHSFWNRSHELWRLLLSNPEESASKLIGRGAARRWPTEPVFEVDFQEIQSTSGS